MLHDVVKKGLMFIGAITVASFAINAVTVVAKRALLKDDSPKVRCACFCVGDDDDTDVDDVCEDCASQDYTVDPEDEGSMPFES